MEGMERDELHTIAPMAWRMQANDASELVQRTVPTTTTPRATQKPTAIFVGALLCEYLQEWLLFLLAECQHAFRGVDLSQSSGHATLFDPLDRTQPQ